MKSGSEQCFHSVSFLLRPFQSDHCSLFKQQKDEITSHLQLHLERCEVSIKKKKKKSVDTRSAQQFLSEGAALVSGEMEKKVGGEKKSVNTLL